MRSVERQVKIFREDDISSLQRQVDTLNSKIATFGPPPVSPSATARLYYGEEPSPATVHRSRFTSSASTDWRGSPHPRQFHGPTSSEYDFNVAKSSLRTMGIQRDRIEEEEYRDTSRHDDLSPNQTSPITLAADMMWNISQDDAIRLTQLYQDECSLLYPLVDIRQTITNIDLIYHDIRSGRRASQSSGLASEHQTNVVRLILAIGLLLDNNDSSVQIAHQIFQIMEPLVSLKTLRPPNLESVILSVLMATYLFHADEEDSAWRWIGIAARACYEMGLHRTESLHRAFLEPKDCKEAVRIFWIVYSLDRRWSFGTGMPFAMQDSDIDWSLPEPSDDDLYLKHITKCNRIMSKIWSLNLENETTKASLKHSSIEFLEYQVSQWYSELPPPLKISKHSLGHLSDAGHQQNPQSHLWSGYPSTRGLDKLRVLLALRANLATLQIYRPVLHSATNINLNISYAKRAVEVAKQTISLLVNVNNNTSLYRDQQVLYNYFLVQALAVIFLATSHAPADFLGHTSKEFFDAIGLVKHFSMKSTMTKRLWTTIRDLKTLREKIRALDKRSSLPQTPADSHTLSATGSFPQCPPSSATGASIDAHLHTTVRYRNTGAEGWTIHSMSPSARNMPPPPPPPPRTQPPEQPSEPHTSQPGVGSDLNLDSDALQMSNDLVSLFDYDSFHTPVMPSPTSSAPQSIDPERDLEKEKEREAYSKIWAEIF